MSDSTIRRKLRKGPNYHRIPEVRARRRKITTIILLFLILAWAGVSFWLMTRNDPNLPLPGRPDAREPDRAVDPLRSIKP